MLFRACLHRAAQLMCLYADTTAQVSSCDGDLSASTLTDR